MPMLASTSTLTPSSVQGSLIASRTRWASSTAASSSNPGTSNANSSPPRRATVAIGGAGRCGDGRGGRRETRGDLADQQVAVMVAEGVVDLLEPVEVGEHDRGVGTGASQRRTQPVLEALAVGEAGE